MSRTQGQGSRTGTTEWLRIRAYILKRDEANDVTHCRYCNTRLNYKVSRQPNSAEPDHIVPWERGGRNTEHNLISICRRCNQSKGNRNAPKQATLTKAKPLRVSRQW